MSESLYDFCQQYDRQYLLEEWDYITVSKI